MVSTCPPTSESFSPFSYPLVTVPNAPITIGIIVTFMFHSFFNSIARSRYFSFFLHSFSFILVLAGRAKSTILYIIIFCWLLLGLVFWPRLGDPCVCQSPMGVYVSFSRTGAGLCVYHLLEWSSLNFLHISQWITFPTQSCLVLYSFCANFLHSLIMWFIVSSLSPRSLHLLFCWVLSILANYLF